MNGSKIFLAGLLLALAQPAPAETGTDERTWRFRVWLDDREIGYHEFALKAQDGNSRVRSEARFEYRLLFIKLYDYRHENLETWEGGCLSRIESRTEANGKRYEVLGERRDGRFLLAGADAPGDLPQCVKSFAYWDPAFLEAPRLLNAQNGELVDIEVSEPQPDRVTVRGAEQDALRYRLQAGELDIHLWYSADRQWLALETEARGGRRLRYELL